MDITGRIVKGVEEGAFYVKKYNRYFLEKLGFEAFPGTLNITVKNPPTFNNPLTITPKEEGLYPVGCVKVVVNGELDAALVIPEKTRHGKNILEIVAPVSIKDHFSLEEGDEVTVRT